MNRFFCGLCWVLLLAALGSVGKVAAQVQSQSSNDPDGPRINPNAPVFIEQKTRFALVIANQGYRTPGFPNAVRDGTAIRDALVKHGFDADFSRDTSRQELIESIRRFTQKLNDKSEAFFVFLGHATQYRDRNYFLPVDEQVKTESEIALYGVEMNFLLQGMERAKGRINVVVVDAAVVKPFGDTLIPVRLGLADVRAPANSYVVLSAAPGKTVSNKIAGQSLFAQQFLRALPEAAVPVESLFKQIRDAVGQSSDGEQLPWDLSSLRSAFILERNIRQSGSDEGQQPNAQQLELLSQLSADRMFWDSVNETARLRDYRSYLARYPNGQFTALAKRRVADLEARGEQDVNPLSSSATSLTLADGSRFVGPLLRGQPHGAGDLISASGDIYTGNFVNGMRTGLGRLVWRSGDIYVGPFKDNKAHGFGSMVFRDGASYTGNFEDGVLQGKGRMQAADGSVYLGEFVKAQRHGIGQLTLADGARWEASFVQDEITGRAKFFGKDGSRQEGEFKAGLLEGDGGLIVLADGTRFEGRFREGKLFGPGRQVLKDGTLTEGGFENNRPVGRLKLRFPSGQQYEGELLNSLPHGQGKLLFPDGQRYEGELRQGVPHGKGRLSFSDGQTYEGEFEQGKSHGLGVLTIPNQMRTSGRFVQGEPHGEVEVEFLSTKGKYRGTVQGGIPQGQGEFRFADGAVQVGNFDRGQLNGKGEIRFADSSVHSGNFVNGQIDGQGQIRFADGSTIQGMIRQGKLHGKGVWTLADRRVFEAEFSNEGKDAVGVIRLPDGTQRAAEMKDLGISYKP